MIEKPCAWVWEQVGSWLFRPSVNAPNAMRSTYPYYNYQLRSQNCFHQNRFRLIAWHIYYRAFILNRRFCVNDNLKVTHTI